MPGQLRSEDAEYERARRELARTPPASIIGALLSPQHAGVTDAIRRGNLARMQATGYDPLNPPGAGALRAPVYSPPPRIEGPAQVPNLGELEKNVPQPGLPIGKWWDYLRGRDR